MDIRKFSILSTIFVIFVGTLLNFAYGWSSQNIIVGLFSAINESTWEHLKLLFYPMLITSIAGYFFVGKNTSNYWCVRVIGIILAMALTIVLFYTYSGILGYNIDIINISIFVISVIIGEYVSYKLLQSLMVCKTWKAILTLVIISAMFTIFTSNPPSIGLFVSPV